MIEQATARFRNCLQGEITSWQDEGLISCELAATLKARYPKLHQSSQIITVLLIVGAVLTGLGSLLFICANWASMTRIAKVALIIAAMLACYLGAWHCKFQPGTKPKLGSALLFLGCLIYGSGIGLACQIFNCDTPLNNIILLWMLGVSALAIVTRSAAITILVSLMVPVWSMSESGRFFPAGAQSSHALQFLLSLAAAGWLCFHTRSRAAMYVLTINATLWSGSLLAALWAGPTLLGVVFFSTYLWTARRYEELSVPLLNVGAVATLSGLMLGTFNISGYNLTEPGNLCTVLLAALIPSLLAVWKDKARQLAVFSSLTLAIGSAWLSCVASDPVRVMLCHVELIAILACLVTVATRLHKPALLNIALVFIVVDITARYFDLFNCLLNRSLFFVLGGIVLLGAGTIAERNRRRLME